jgi:predicted GTPase
LENPVCVTPSEACTREPQRIFIGAGKSGIELIDLPGIGEDPARQKEYVALYESLAPELDLVLWTIKADDRNYASGLEAYQQIFGKREGLPVVFVITQVDKTNPNREWDWESFSPSEKQVSNIAVKERDVSRRFDISAKNIISVAVGEEDPNEKYNVVELVDLIVEVLPNEKKFSFARETKEDNVSSESREKAERGVWDSIKDFAGNAWDTVKDTVVDKLVESAPKIFSAAATFIGGLFKKKWF